MSCDEGTSNGSVLARKPSGKPQLSMSLILYILRTMNSFNIRKMRARGGGYGQFPRLRNLAIALITIISITITNALPNDFYVCDCNRPVTKGILDLQRPHYCEVKQEPVVIQRARYTIFSTQEMATKFPATLCESWEKIKKVTGFFWAGVYDTEHFQYTRDITAAECREMRQNRKCGSGEEQHMMVGENELTYSAEPTGEGHWMQVKTYRTINCKARKIELWQDKHDGPVWSPIGELSDPITSRSSQINHNTIVWEIPPNYDNTCKVKIIKEGKGKIRSTKTSTRLVDAENQLEILYKANKTTLCDGRIVHMIEGLPNTFVQLYEIGTEITLPNNQINEKARKRRESDSAPTVTKEWGIRNNLISFNDDETLVESISAKGQSISISPHEQKMLGDIDMTRYYWGKIQYMSLRPEKPPRFISSGKINDTLKLFPALAEDQDWPWEDFNQEFEWNTDYTLRKFDSNLCFTVVNHDVHLEKCSLETSKWTYDSMHKLILEVHTGLCLTRGINLTLEVCNKKVDPESQHWMFEFFNVKLQFFDKPRLHVDLQQPIEMVSNHSENNKATKSAFAYGFLRVIGTETCLTTLPKAFQRVYPFKCDIDNTSRIQNYAFMPDLTIRPVNSDLCLTLFMDSDPEDPKTQRKRSKTESFGIRLLLAPCSTAATRWFMLNTNQLAGIDLTRLIKIPKCLTKNGGHFEMADCVQANSRDVRMQQWKFDYKQVDEQFKFSLSNITNIITDLLKIVDEPNYGKARFRLWYEVQKRKDFLAHIYPSMGIQLDSPKSTPPTSPPYFDRDHQIIDGTMDHPNATLPRTINHQFDNGDPNFVDKVNPVTEPTLTQTKTNFEIKNTVENLPTIKTKDNIEIANNKPDTQLLNIKTEINKSDTLPTLPPDWKPSFNNLDVNTTTTTTTTTTTSPSSISIHHRGERQSIENKIITTPTKVPELVQKPVQPAITSSTHNATEAKSNNNKEANTTKPDIVDAAYIQSLLSPLHNQWKQEIEVEHENLLATETRDLYCETLNLRRLQLITAAQWSGLFAAQSMNLGRCSRIQSIGVTLLLQECKIIPVTITAKETKCGFQPHLKYKDENFTIGMDGYSLQPFQPCFWNSHFVSINGKTFSWNQENGTAQWVEQDPTIPIHSLNLVSEFKQIILKDYDYELKAHTAHEKHDFESINILSEIMGHMQGAEVNSLTNLVYTEKKDLDFNAMFSWTKVLKICVAAIAILLFLGVIAKILQILIPRRRRQNNILNPEEEHVPMLQPSMPYQPVVLLTQPSVSAGPSAPRPSKHAHVRCVVKPGIGLVYEGCGCKCA